LLRAAVAMSTTVRLLVLAVFAAVAAACASSQQQSPGVASPQKTDACLPRKATCTTNNDCCTQFCANGVCVQKEP
jgi:hypothetical protein